MKYILTFFIFAYAPNFCFSQTQAQAGIKIHYQGKLKNVSFDYFSNWELDEDATALALSPDGWNTFIEIHRDTLTLSEAQLLNYTPATFNGMKAYNYNVDSYFIIRDNVEYMFSAVHSNPAYESQLKEIMGSFTIKD